MDPSGALISRQRGGQKLERLYLPDVAALERCPGAPFPLKGDGRHGSWSGSGISDAGCHSASHGRVARSEVDWATGKEAD